MAEPGDPGRSIRALLVDGSPRGGGRTATVLSAIAAGVEAGGGTPVSMSLSGELGARAIEVTALAAEFDAFVFGTPTYRASYTAELKYLLDRMPRAMWGETEAPLRARAVAIAVTGASLHHFLAVDALRSVLAGFFGAYVVPPGLYVPHEGFSEDGELLEDWREAAILQGKALVELARAIAASASLGAVAPQA
jgi:FMN reductase